MRLWWMALVALGLTQTSAWGQQPTLQVLYNFQGRPDGVGPVGNMVFDTSGNLYGVTAGGGAGCCVGPVTAPGGTVFELAPDGTETVLYSFCSVGAADCIDGGRPTGALIMDAAGNLYGTTERGGDPNSFGKGAVFELSYHPDSNTWVETVLHGFCSSPVPVNGVLTCPDGDTPVGNLVMDRAGDLYGATFFGGKLGFGVLYQLHPNATGTKWTERVVRNFRDGSNFPVAAVSGLTPGRFPDFSVYGATGSGGSGPCDGGCGTIFKITPR